MVTVAEFMREWLAIHTPTVRVRTGQNYASHVRNYINPVIGDKLTNELTPLDVAAIGEYMMGRGIAVGTIRLTQTIMRKAFDYAVLRKYMGENVAKMVGQIHVPAQPPRLMTMDTLRELSDAIKGARFANVLRLALVQGFRRGEVCALRWSDIDFDQRTISIERQVTRVDGIGLVVQEPKTTTSMRVVPMTMVAFDILSDLYQYRSNSSWVFPGTGDMPVDPHRVYIAFQAVLEANDLPRMGLHQLRHAFGTILRAQGVSERTLMDLFGHSSTRMTARYGRVVDELKIAAVSTMDAALGGM